MATVDQILNALQSDDEKIRQNAVVALIKSLNPKAIQYLEMIAQNDPSEQVRKYAIRGIQYIKENISSAKASVERSKDQNNNTPQTAEKNNKQEEQSAPIGEIPAEFLYIKKYLHSDFKEEVLYGIQSIRENNIRSYLPEILKCLTTHTDADIIAASLHIIGAFGNTSYVKLIAPYIKNFNSNVRKQAVETLEMLGSEDICTYIIPVAKDSDIKCRAAVKKALMKYGEDVVIAQIKQMIPNCDNTVLEHIAFVLSFFNSNTAVAMLAEFLKSDNDAIKKQAERSLQIIADDFGNNNAAAHIKTLSESQKNHGNIDIFDKLSSVAENDTGSSYSVTNAEDDIFSKLSNLTDEF